MKASMALFQFRDRTLPYSLHPSPTPSDVLVFLPPDALIAAPTWQNIFSEATSAPGCGRVCVIENWPARREGSSKNEFLFEFFEALGFMPQVLILNPEGLSRVATDAEDLIAKLKGLVVVTPSPVSWDAELRAWRTQLKKESPILLIETVADAAASSAAKKDFERQWSEVKSFKYESQKVMELAREISRFLLNLN